MQLKKEDISFNLVELEELAKSALENEGKDVEQITEEMAAVTIDREQNLDTDSDDLTSDSDDITSDSDDVTSDNDDVTSEVDGVIAESDDIIKHEKTHNLITPVSDETKDISKKSCKECDHTDVTQSDQSEYAGSGDNVTSDKYDVGRTSGNIIKHDVS